MSIPLDRLYNYIDNVCTEVSESNVLIYRFAPNGSKKLSDLKKLKGFDSWKDEAVCLEVYCNDQEPLTYEFYEQSRKEFIKGFPFVNVCSKFGFEPMNQQNFRIGSSIYEFAILLHSEKNSIDLEKYQASNFVPVYYWSHGMISQDWFRYAQHVEQTKSVKKTFLIYNRAWAGTREYRLKFADLLVESNLHSDCQMSINSIDPESNVHYTLHQFSNLNFRPKYAVENYFPVSTAQSHYSADFDLEDYESTEIEVVLETLFDDTRLHLTEKSLRPIACGQPFILAGTAGSLEYLRNYGFKTFGSLWNETYDQITDPVQRLSCIVALMQQIVGWSPEHKKEILQQAQIICDYNKRHFFSQKFLDQIKTELKINMDTGIKQLTTRFDPNYWSDRWKFILSHRSVYKFIKDNKFTYMPTLEQIDEIFDYLDNLKTSNQ